MIKTLEGVVNGQTSLGRRLDAELVETLMPELRDCKGSLDKIRRQTAIELVYNWHRELVHALTDGAKAEMARATQDREALVKLKVELEAVNIKLQETQGDLRAAKEGRGLYEDKARAELQRQLTAKEKLLEQASQLEQTQRETIASLQAELRGRLATVQRYEWDISQLTTAAAANADQTRKDKVAMDALIKEARAALGQARDDIISRWGSDRSPFMEAIYNNIVTALTRLPPST